MPATTGNLPPPGLLPGHPVRHCMVHPTTAGSCARAPASRCWQCPASIRRPPRARLVTDQSCRVSVMYYPDLHTECAVDSGPDTRAVGWLSPLHPFVTRPASPSLLRRLADHLEAAWSPADSLGPGDCEFCGQPVRRRSQSGQRRPHSEALWIPGPAVVYVAPGAVLTEAEVISHCKARLEDFMVPRKVEFRAELPKTGSGKVRRIDLR